MENTNIVSYAASVLVDYGNGTSPILPLSIKCDREDSELSECSRKELDASQCSSVAGVDCIGTFCLFYGRADSLSLYCSSLCY